MHALDPTMYACYGHLAYTCIRPDRSIFRIICVCIVHYMSWSVNCLAHVSVFVHAWAPIACMYRPCLQGDRRGVGARRSKSPAVPWLQPTSRMASSASSDLYDMPNDEGSPRGIRLMTLDTTAGPTPSHLAHDGVKGMLGLFERRVGASAFHDDTSRPGNDAHSSVRRSSGDDERECASCTVRHQPQYAAVMPCAPARPSAGAFVCCGDSVCVCHRTGVDAPMLPLDARGRWVRATKLVVHVVRVCSHRKKRGVSVGCLRRLREIITAVPGGADMTTQEACEKIVKPMCVAAGGMYLAEHQHDRHLSSLLGSESAQMNL